MSKYFEKRKSDDQLYYNYLTKNKYKDYMKDIYDRSLKLSVVGIVCQKENSNSLALSTTSLQITIESLLFIVIK